MLRPILAALLLSCSLWSTPSSAQGVGTPAFTATYNSAAEIPLSAPTFVATGTEIEFALNFHPAAITDLTVVDVTGLDFIVGRFDNLAHGETVTLTNSGIGFQFVADYYGGSGNDLVLRWANTRLYSWGQHPNLAIDTTDNLSTPERSDLSTVQNNNATILKVSSGGSHALFLFSDGTLAATGFNTFGSLGNPDVRSSTRLPVEVDRSGVLAEKTIASIAAGGSHSLALCSDGTVAAWGSNSDGQLGNGTEQFSVGVPVEIDLTNLEGRTVVGIAAGGNHSLALCNDGTVWAWGDNRFGKLGNGSSDSRSNVPVPVSRDGVLAGKTVTQIAAGGNHNVVLTADGLLASWGAGLSGQLGRGGVNENSDEPGLVDQSGLLDPSIRRVTQICCGEEFVIALCDDQSIAAWGDGRDGKLARGTTDTTDSNVPIAVDRGAFLQGKTVVQISCGGLHTLARTSDGSLAAWGNGSFGQLGSGDTASSGARPVRVDLSPLEPTERLLASVTGAPSRSSHAVVGGAPFPTAGTLPPSELGDTQATLNAEIHPNGTPTTITFEYGLTTEYGHTLPSVPAQVTGTGAHPVSAPIDGLLPNTTYHFRVIAENLGGRVIGANQTFTTTAVATLSGLILIDAPLTPSFDPKVFNYSATVPFATSNLLALPIPLHPDATMTVNGTPLPLGSPSAPLPLAPGNNPIAVEVTSGNGVTSIAYTVTVTRIPDLVTWTSAADVPITAEEFSAQGDAPTFQLDLAPTVGTSLTLVDLTGPGRIESQFTDLPHGAAVSLTFNGITYPFFADYFGGDGNDLVLAWGNTRLVAWGSNNSGQLGTGDTIDALVPVPVIASGALAGSNIRSVATSWSHSLAITRDGTLAAWGENQEGTLGDGTSQDRFEPVAVTVTEFIEGKAPIAIHSESYRSYALFSDGSLAEWGTGSPDKRVPSPLDDLGVLAGKTVIATATGREHRLALCSDGTLAAWGENDQGQLGIGTQDDSTVPVEVNRDGVLKGKSVAWIAAGDRCSFAMCTDGTLAAWGSNSRGQLGDGTTIRRLLPVEVDLTGVLAGKEIVAIASGGEHTLALCADGALAAWGYNSRGELGTADPVQSLVPALTNRSGALAGKTISAIAAGGSFSLAVTSDGMIAGWGYNNDGRLGNNSTTDSSIPVEVNTNTLLPGERFLTTSPPAAASSHSFAIVVSPPRPGATTLAASDLTNGGANLHANVAPNGSETTVWFEYGLTDAYGSTLAANPALINGTGETPVNAILDELRPGTDYHFRVVAKGPGGITIGADQSFTTSMSATLSSLTTNEGVLTPTFDSAQSEYSLTVPFATSSLRVTPTASFSEATIEVNGTAVTSGAASAPIPLAEGTTAIPIVVSADGGDETFTYTINATRIPAIFTFPAPGEIPIVATSFVANGSAAVFALEFAPEIGTDLTVIDNRGLAFITGTFTNLSQGDPVILKHDGIEYRFVANYFGGTGNDLVLQWANTRLLGWGRNNRGQLGNGRNDTSNLFPRPVVDSLGVLTGQRVLSVSGGGEHTVALLADGALAAWGSGSSASLGVAIPSQNTFAPVSIGARGDLAGRTVVAVYALGFHSIALCSDGSIVGWGTNFYGHLGNTGAVRTETPTLLQDLGALAGKKVVAIAPGESHTLALCDDGTIAAWGRNTNGELGTGSNDPSIIPVQVGVRSALAGRKVVRIASGQNHSLALCDDGTLYSWGFNSSGQLGNGDTKNQNTPVAVLADGALAGKRIVDLAAGGSFSMALCDDGRVVTWGENSSGQLGDGNSPTDSSVPVAVDASGLLAGRTVVRITASRQHGMAQCSDGTIAGWGSTSFGLLGTGDSNPPATDVPVAVSTDELVNGERFVSAFSGPSGLHSFGMVASAPRATIDAAMAISINANSAILNAVVHPNGSEARVEFEFGPTTEYGQTVSATPSPAVGPGPAAVSTTLARLLPGTTYHFRPVVTNAGGIAYGDDQTFTTTSLAALSNLELSSGTLSPGFASNITSYLSTVPFAVDSLSVTAETSDPAASVQLAGGNPVALAVGNNPITVTVTGSDGITILDYGVVVTRLPESIDFQAVTDVPIIAEDFAASGDLPPLSLRTVAFPGTNLLLVDNTGTAQIEGTFDNLAHGQLVELTWVGVQFPFVANYSGGDGNDLVLQWANTRVTAWGANNNRQLGTTSLFHEPFPADVLEVGALAGKTVLALSAYANHHLALLADGTIASWGSNSDGQLGNGTREFSSVPVEVDRSGVLNGRRIIQIATGTRHSLALCADGTIAAWGEGQSGQLGNGETVDQELPVEVDRRGVLAGKTVLALAAGDRSSYALCNDGTIASWGLNSAGQLGTESVNAVSNLPVEVSREDVLANRRVTAITSGYDHCLAICDDGALVSWGSNAYGELGRGLGTDSFVPVLVDASGVLNGKTVIDIAAGRSHSIALCRDGTLAGWGRNEEGTTGTGERSNVPLPVTVTPAIAGKDLVAVEASVYNSIVLASDGTLATWGSNSTQQLGNGSTINSPSQVPVAVNLDGLGQGERYIATTTGLFYYLGLVASPPAPSATTADATSITDTTATLHGSVSTNGSTTDIIFEYGERESFGKSTTARPGRVLADTDVSAPLTGLFPGTTYYFRPVASSAGGISYGETRSFTTTAVATLASLELSDGTFTPALSFNEIDYSATVANSVTTLTVTPTVTDSGILITVNGVPVTSGTASAPIFLNPGRNSIGIVLIEGSNQAVYRLTVTRLPATFSFTSPTSGILTAPHFDIGGMNADFALGYAPLPGTNLTVLDNTGPEPIAGEFLNLEHGQLVALPFGNTNYQFAANYFGGDGNDLVLQWANTALYGWGSNGRGELGELVNRTLLPSPLHRDHPLSSETIFSLASGEECSFALTSSGKVFSWGSNREGRLGDGTRSDRLQPVLVDDTGVLAGKIIVAIAPGASHCLALCSDNTLVSWGDGDSGKLGNGDRVIQPSPVLVDQSGVLAGKTIRSIAAGREGSFALCTDGTLAAWGTTPTLGNNASQISSLPVLVDQSGFLREKTIVRIAAGGSHVLALCSDGTLAAWGGNSNGQIGDDSTQTRFSPVRINTGVLQGRIVTDIAASLSHSLALTGDGTLAAWGRNQLGALGDGTTINRLTPVAVDRSGVLAGKTTASLQLGSEFNFLFDTNQQLYSWGYNNNGALGDGTRTTRSSPILVDISTLEPGHRLMATGAGNSAGHVIALAGAPPAPVVVTSPARDLTDNSATLVGTVNPNDSETTPGFEWGLGTDYENTLAATPSPVTGNTAVEITASLADLPPGATVYYRAIATSSAGTARGEGATLTTTTDAALSGLALSAGSLNPTFQTPLLTYNTAVPFPVADLTVTPTAASGGSTIEVNGAAVASGEESAALPLAVGTNTLSIAVTSPDGLQSTGYQVDVIRLPEEFRFDTADQVAVSLSFFTASGLEATFALGFAPTPGTQLMVIENTGLGFIEGTFANLAHGQPVTLSFDGSDYQFVANYFGGNGNDLVLQWAGTRIVRWGAFPEPVNPAGALSGRSILKHVWGYHDFALLADGEVLGWGNNDEGQLGDGTTTTPSRPVSLDRSGVLAGKTIVQLAAGNRFSLALCSDGTVAAWGVNDQGQLGLGTTDPSPLPIAVDQGGLVAGKQVVAIAASNSSSFALCADGALAAWGRNDRGQLGDNSNETRLSPVLVDTNGVLRNRIIKSFAIGESHVVALCTDGAIATWGSNDRGQLGIGGLTSSTRPVLVDSSGVLGTKTITVVTAGQDHCLALCDDGTIVGWGDNGDFQMGQNLPGNRAELPVAVPHEGALAGRTVIAIAAGANHSAALCSDRTIASWGANSQGQLGNGMSNTRTATPVEADTSRLLPGEGFMSLIGQPVSNAGVALTGVPQWPSATTTAAIDLQNTGATLTGEFDPDGAQVELFFDYGPTRALGTPVPAQAGALDGTTFAPVTNLLPGITYYFQLRLETPIGPVTGGIQSFATGNSATLTSLVLSDGSLHPPFAPTLTSFTASLPFATDSITVTPGTATPDSTVEINGAVVSPGTPSGAIPLAPGANQVEILVTAPGGYESFSYLVDVIRLPETIVFSSPGESGVSASSFTAAGLDLPPVDLQFTPSTGEELVIFNNTGPALIQGQFGNLAQGAVVELEVDDATYRFLANYFGGDGNDLSLQWASTRLIGWGRNRDGQLGNGNINDTGAPVAAGIGGALSDKKAIATTIGASVTLAVASDGSLTSWGESYFGLGVPDVTESLVPIDISQSGALAGKTVVTTSAASEFWIALCADGTLAAWGENRNGQLGVLTPGEDLSRSPVEVDTSGALAGKTPIDVSSGRYHTIALCSDGTMVGWGGNFVGQLGVAEISNSRVPIPVNQSGVLSGKKVVAISCGFEHSLALCDDGTVAAWGNNDFGQLGDNTNNSSNEPVVVDTSGVLAGKTVIAISAGVRFNLALCSDGTLVTWGLNSRGQLGNDSFVNSPTPVAVDQSGVLAGKSVEAITAGPEHCLVLCTDGKLAAWGSNQRGVIGDLGSESRLVPVEPAFNSLEAGERVLAFPDHHYSDTNILVVATPAPAVTTLPATGVANTSTTLRGSVQVNGTPSEVWFEFGETTDYGSTLAADPAQVDLQNATAVSLPVDGLAPNTAYHYRAVVRNAAGTQRGADQSFTTGSGPLFAGYIINTAFETPVEVGFLKLLTAASDPDGEIITITGAGPATNRGGTATLLATTIRYTPPPGFSGIDTFPLAVTDFGGSATVGTVTVLVGNPNGGFGPGNMANNPGTFTVTGDGRMQARFQGIPGRHYNIQRSTNMLSWEVIATVTAAPNGAVTFTDHNPPQPSAYYRLAVP